MKGVIFDFNGTMFFDSDKQEKAWRMYIKKMTGRDVSDEEFKERVHGRVEFFFENLNLDRWFDLEKVVYTMEL